MSTRRRKTTVQPQICYASKQEQKDMESLREQLKQSRIAVVLPWLKQEQATQCRKEERENINSIEQIGNELKQCAIQINSEEKKSVFPS